MGQLDEPKNWPPGYSLTHELVGRKDGSISFLYRGTDQDGAPVWVEVLDKRFADDQNFEIIGIFEDVRKKDGYEVKELDGRFVVVRNTQPTTLNNADVLQGIYDFTKEDGNEAEARQAIGVAY